MRYPSARSLGVQYLIAVLLPFLGHLPRGLHGVQLAIAHATNTVRPTSRIADAALPLDYVPSEENGARGSLPPNPPTRARILWLGRASAGERGAGHDRRVFETRRTHAAETTTPGNPAVPGDRGSVPSPDGWPRCSRSPRRRLARFPGVVAGSPPPSPDPAPAPSHAPRAARPRASESPPGRPRDSSRPTASRVPPFPSRTRRSSTPRTGTGGGKAAGRVCTPLGFAPTSAASR